MEPYVVTAALFSVTHLDNYGLDELEKHYQEFAKHKKANFHQ